ncbi:hypothetical protein [Clostridium botulinum]|uniref:hypothetical protein n=1 Tax=Clostridium botulinum TaxID=1491 RepID=UPI0004B5969C|nr:hypothetical protein [Clostridium botulinum]
MNKIIIGQKRKWINPEYTFKIIEEKIINNKTMYILQYEDDSRKQTQTEEAILSKSVVI